MMLSEHSKKLANHSANFSGLIKFLITYLVLRRSTSRAITNSSSVGITITLTLLAGVVISLSSPLKLFTDSSKSTHNQLSLSAISFLCNAEFSSTPAVKTIASTPQSNAAYPPIVFKIALVYISRTSVSLSLPSKYPASISLKSLPI